MQLTRDDVIRIVESVIKDLSLSVDDCPPGCTERTVELKYKQQVIDRVTLNLETGTKK
jgi:hypothetical protein